MAQATSPDGRGAAWDWAEMIRRPVKPTNSMRERNELCTCFHLGGEGFENQKYGNEKGNGKKD
jgi:hypothetical protein